jgi:hypothetical protein
MMFDYSGWLIAGIISGYKTGEVSFCKTTERTDKYLELGKITQAQAIEIAIACPEPSVEPETVVEEPETPITDETVIEDETPVIEETTGE